MTGISSDSCDITLDDIPAADAFSLTLTIDGKEALVSVAVDGPGVFRASRGASDRPFAEGRYVPRGGIVGFLQRGVLALPIPMPEDGWPVAFAPDGIRVEHGSSVVRYVPVLEAITP